MRTAAYVAGLLFVLHHPLVAQSTTPTTTAPVASATPSDSQLHQELRDLKKVMEEALNSRNVDAMLAHVDEQVVFTTMNGDVVTGRDGVRAYFDKMMNGPAKVVESVRASFIPDTLSILRGGDVAISWGRTDDHYELSTGQSLAVAARWSATMVRRDGRWLIANFHYSTNMFDNPVLSAQRTLLIGSGVGGALVLGLVGFLYGRRRRGG
ncbi:MAG: SgcJ/EcaC family oxidoreductase [Gemmatimonadaceae bacterium]|nr:SgcJ/EcaC family oxidoreductase [Gemmatimonadaceae bacterium]